MGRLALVRLILFNQRVGVILTQTTSYYNER